MFEDQNETQNELTKHEAQENIVYKDAKCKKSLRLKIKYRKYVYVFNRNLEFCIHKNCNF